MLGRTDDATVATALAQVDSSTLARSFLLALVLVAPYALWQWSRIRARRRERQVAGEAAAASAEPERGSAVPPALEDLIGRVTSLGRTLTADQQVELDVPADLAIDGSPADDALVDALVGDALARSGLHVVADIPGEHLGVRRRLLCRRRTP